MHTECLVINSSTITSS